MKTLVCSIAALFLCVFTINAQEEAGVKKETVTKTVVKKDGRIHTKVTDQVTEEKEHMNIQESDALNQGRKVTTQNKTTTKVVSEEVKADKANDAMIKERKINEEKEIKQSGNARKLNDGRGQKADVQAVDGPQGSKRTVKKVKKVKKDSKKVDY